jgi:two-component system, cell cycle response regulator
MPIESGTVNRGGIFLVTKVYEYLLKAAFALLPSLGIWYLQVYQSPMLCEVDHGFHNTAIFAAILTTCFVAYVTWRCYRYSGEPFLRWMTLGSIGFALIYAPHGLFTGISDTHLALFLLYGPASRLVMVLLLFVGLLRYAQGRDSLAERERFGRWWRWAAFFIVIDLLVALVAETSLLQLFSWRLWLEGNSLLLALIGVVIVFVRHRASPLMMTFALALSLFAQSSAAFLLAKPWNHLWWYAHGIFALGVFILNYGVVRAFHTTGAFSTVFSVEELMSRLRAEKKNTDDALLQLREANAELVRIASTDSLTGASNRRHFLECVELELERAGRNGSAMSLLALDVDLFKSVNDQYGHQTGDLVLKFIVEQITETLRLSDVIGRVGGEEFMILLPDTSKDAASVLAERIRSQVDRVPILLENGALHVTISIGVAEFGLDGNTIDEVFKVSDMRMYQAKRDGRNRVVS